MRRSWGAVTLERHAAGPAVTRALDAAIDAIDPARAVEAALGGHGPGLTIAGHRRGSGRCVVVGMGKAALAMARPLAARLGEDTRGIVVSKTPGRVPGLQTIVAGHPLPNVESERAGRAIGAAIEGLGPDDMVVVLLSGGASSLVIDPPPGIDRDALELTSDRLLRAGADIEALNTVRKHLDGLKGGGLAARAAPARVIALVLSDVPGDRLETIASGPTVGDPTTFADALAVLERHAVEAPPAVMKHLRAGAAGAKSDTPEPGDARVSEAFTTIVARNGDATAAATRVLREHGFAVAAPTSTLEGEARDAGRELAASLLALPRDRPRALLTGGETVVHVRGEGRGGRNQEVALAAAEVLAGHPAHLLCALATDGEDGPTDAAGAVVDGGTIARGSALGLSAADHLARNDAYPWFRALDDLLRPGSTGTNACDVAIAVYDPRVRS